MLNLLHRAVPTLLTRLFRAAILHIAWLQGYATYGNSPTIGLFVNSCTIVHSKNSLLETTLGLYFEIEHALEVVHQIYLTVVVLRSDQDAVGAPIGATELRS